MNTKNYKIMKIYDLSIDISENTVVWKTDPKVKFKQVKSISKGDSANISEIKMGTHTGTHIDAPLHFINSKKSIDKIKPAKLLGKVSVIQILSKKIIEPEDLKNKILLEKVIFKTDNSLLWKKNLTEFQHNYSAISSRTAKFLIKNKIHLAGIDYLSIGLTGKDSHLTHKLLLKNNIVIVEGLNLSEVKEGIYNIVCAPLKLKGLDGAPTRVFLIEL